MTSKLWWLAPVVGLMAACGGGGGPDGPASPAPADSAALNSALRALPAWQTPRTVNQDTRDLQSGTVTVGTETYQCTVSDPIPLDPATTEYKDILVAGLDSDSLYPGALLQGKGVAQGQFDLVRLARAPITLTTTMNIAEPSITVADPNAATMRNAVATLARRGDSRTGAIDVTSGTVQFRKVEAFSFAQSLNEVGVSMAYSNPLAQLSADFNYGSGRTANSYSVLVSLVQPLFKVSFSEDGITGPADLLAPGVSKAQLDGEMAAGRIAPDNLPVYVKSVTYGRLMMYTLTSSQVSSYAELAAAVEGSYKGFSASGAYTQVQREIIANSQQTLISFGGPQAAAVAAILDLDKYFVPMQPTQAVPISYEVRDVNGNVAAIGDVTEYRRRDCTRQAPVFNFSVRLGQVDDEAWIRINGVERGPHAILNSAPTQLISLGPWTNAGWNDLEIVLFNHGLTFGSLNHDILLNDTRVGGRNYSVNSPICLGGCFYHWFYRYNKTTGEVQFVSTDA